MKRSPYTGAVTGRPDDLGAKCGCAFHTPALALWRAGDCRCDHGVAWSAKICSPFVPLLPVCLAAYLPVVVEQLSFRDCRVWRVERARIQFNVQLKDYIAQLNRNCRSRKVSGAARDI